MTCACKAAASFEKQQKMMWLSAGAAASVLTAVETAIRAARSAGKR
jgi:hypothetical protein